MVEWPVSQERLAGGLIQYDLPLTEEMVDFIAPLGRNEEKLARAAAPLGEELLVREEDGWRVGKGAAKEH